MPIANVFIKQEIVIISIDVRKATSRINACKNRKSKIIGIATELG